MSSNISTKRIVTNGLTLYLDAANTKSYSGAGTSWNDLSQYVNNGTLINGPTYVNTNKGIITFDGTNDYVTTTAALSYTSYTKSVWFYTANLSSGNNLISGGDSNPNAQHFFWLGGGNKLTAGHNTSYYLIQSVTTLNINTWYYAVVTFSSTTGWVMYLNGIQENTNASTTTFTGGTNILLGSYNNAGTLLFGGISTASIYNRVLSPDEVLQNYNVTKWRFGY